MAGPRNANHFQTGFANLSPLFPFVLLVRAVVIFNFKPNTTQ